jgi:predicted transcriptional regulator
LRRTNLDVYVDILQSAMNGAKKTRIVYQANLNFQIAKRYMDNLVEGDFMEMEEDGSFRTTTKGINFIKQYKLLVRPLIETTVSIQSSI